MSQIAKALQAHKTINLKEIKSKYTLTHKVKVDINCDAYQRLLFSLTRLKNEQNDVYDGVGAVFNVFNGNRV
ncbi:hypothetical protein THOD04_80254 [Vibrio owensii]|nr:hypothetical protein THOD04_80254 [Vibrio owensii]